MMRMPLLIPYHFLRDKIYKLPPAPYFPFEETGTYIKINDNIYAENAYKTYSAYEFKVNKRGGDTSKVSFNTPLNYFNINDRVEYYLKGKKRFAGYVESIDNAGLNLTIIPVWGRLTYQYIQGDLILIEFKPLNNGQIDSDGITVDQVELTNDGGIGIEGINQSTIQVENTKGDSLINNSVMKKYEDEAIDKQEENNETEASKQDTSDVKNNHEKKEDKKAQNESLNINFIIGIGAIIVVVVVAVIVIFKKKVKK